VLPRWTVIGFSGHRNVSAPQETAQGIATLLDSIESKYAPIAAMSSIARGSDLLFVQEVVKRKIPLLLVLPFPISRFQQDFEPAEWNSAVNFIASAVQVEIVNIFSSDEEAYMETGSRIADRADLMMTAWNGEPAKGLGGTGDVVGYARALRKPLAWFNPVTRLTVFERLETLRGNPAINWNGSPYHAVEAHFNELDATATLKGPRVRHLIYWIVLLHLAASAIGLTTLVLDVEGTAGYVGAILEVSMLGLAFILSLVHHRRGSEWIRSRAEAEICRSFLALWPIRAKIERTPNVSIPSSQRLTRDLRLLQQLDVTATPDLETAREGYLNGRVKSQLEYFNRRCKEAQRSFRLLRRSAIVCTALAGLLAAAHFLLSFKHVNGMALSVMELFSLVLPLISAALLSLILTQEYSRRASRYEEMAVMLLETERNLKATRTWYSVARIAIETEERLLTEAAEWQSFRKFASEPH
jgi:hypothetical protein